MPEDESTDEPTTEAKPAGHVSTGIFRTALSTVTELVKHDRARDAEQTANTIKSLTRIIIALVIVLAMLVSGVVSVGLGVEIPGVGKIEIVDGE